MESGDSSRVGATAKRVLLLLFVLMVGVTSAHLVTALDTDAVGQVSGDEAADGADWLQVSDDGTANDSGERTVARVGDVTGDGTTDLLIGAPGADAEGREDVGAAYLVPGPVERPNVSLTAARATFVGEAPGDRAGHAVAPAGDLDGDGYDDVLVGAPMAGEAESPTGAAYVVYGGENLTGERNLSTADVILTGAPGDRAGWAVDGAGNASPTGAGVIVGAPGWGETDAGAAAFVSNATLANVSTATLASVSDARLVGQDAAAGAGWSVSAGADVDGDGTGDVLVGVPNRTVDGTDGESAQTGAVAVVTGPLSGEYDLANATTLLGDGGDHRVGEAVAGVSDVNGDGPDEILVWAPATNGSATSTRVDRAYLVYGSADSTGTRSLGDGDVTYASDGAGDNTTWSVADGDAPRCDAATGTGAPSQAQRAGWVVPEDFGALVDCLSARSEQNETESAAATPADSGELATTDGSDAGIPADTTGTPADDSVDVGTGSPSTGDAAASGDSQSDAGSIEAEITCEDPEPYVYNPTDGQVTVTVVGPDGTERYALDAGDDVGGVSPPSHQTPSMAPGEYTVTAVDEAGSTVSVNGADSYTTTVKACPTTTLTTECVEPDTAQVSLRAENLTGRHAVPVTVDVQSPSAQDRGTRTVDVGDGTAVTTFEIGTTERATISVRLDGAPGPAQLADATVEAGSCETDATPDQEQPTDSNGSGDGEEDTPAGDGPASESDGTKSESGPTLDAVEATLACEDPEPSLFNPNDAPVDITVDGPDGAESYVLESGDDVGGVQPPSHDTPSLPPGEYTVTAVDENGSQVPVNGEDSYTTTVKACPTASLTTDCVDQDTVRLSFRAEHLTGRHAASVTIRTQSPNAADRWERSVSPSAGVATSEFTVSETERVGVEVRLDADVGAGPLARTTVSAGTCDDVAGATETPAEPATGDDGPTATSTPEPTDTEADEPPGTPTDTGTEDSAATSTDTPADTATAATPDQSTATPATAAGSTNDTDG